MTQELNAACILLMRFQPLKHLLKSITLSLLNLGIFIFPQHGEAYEMCQYR